MILRKLAATLLCLTLVFHLPAHAQSDLNRAYQPKIQTNRDVPPLLNTSLWLMAYTASIYVLSRLEANNYALGIFYFVPSLTPFYQWDPAMTNSESFEIRGENYVFAGLSAYNFLAINPDTQTSDEVFRDNIYANLSLWGSLWYYRKHLKNTEPFLFPILTRNSFGVYLNLDF